VKFRSTFPIFQSLDNSLLPHSSHINRPQPCDGCADDVQVPLEPPALPPSLFILCIEIIGRDMSKKNVGGPMRQLQKYSVESLNGSAMETWLPPASQSAKGVVDLLEYTRFLG